MKQELEFKGDWEEVKERLKDEYPALTDDDFADEDDRDKLVNQLQTKLGKTNKEVREIIRTI